jgi:diacylglycerol O-acyltransferase
MVGGGRADRRRGPARGDGRRSRTRALQADRAADVVQRAHFAHRRFAFGQLSLAEVKAMKNEYGSTVNDVVVSMCAGAVRRWLLERDELPDEPLVAQVPVSARGPKETGTFGNRILLMSVPLFTDEADPVTRLELTHEALLGMKERHRALPADLLQDANYFVPPAVFARAAQLTFRLSSSRPGRPTWNLVISNVPGPQFPLYCAGARLEANYPVSRSSPTAWGSTSPS